MEICTKFKILVLISIQETIFYRVNTRYEESPDARDFDFTLKQGCGRFEYFMRPGFKTFLRRLIEHPRSQFCFNCNFTEKNLMPVLFEILSDKYSLMDLRNKVGIFDQKY